MIDGEDKLKGNGIFYKEGYTEIVLSKQLATVYTVRILKCQV